MSGNISVICRDCGTLLGGPEAGERVFWTICGCKYNPPPPVKWWQKVIRWMHRQRMF